MVNNVASEHYGPIVSTTETVKLNLSKRLHLFNTASLAADPAMVDVLDISVEERYQNRWHLIKGIWPLDHGVIVITSTSDFGNWSLLMEG